MAGAVTPELIAAVANTTCIGCCSFIGCTRYLMGTRLLVTEEVEIHSKIAVAKLIADTVADAIERINDNYKLLK